MTHPAIPEVRPPGEGTRYVFAVTVPDSSSGDSPVADDPNGDAGQSESIPVELIAAMIESAESRRNTTDQMMWQVPVLSLTAQSFLLTIALSSGASAGRIISSLLAAVAAIAAIQLLLKHRFVELTYSHALQRLEEDSGLPPLHGAPASLHAWAWPGGTHAWNNIGPRWKIVKRSRRWLVNRRSPAIWTATLGIFATTDIGIAVAVLFGVL